MIQSGRRVLSVGQCAMDNAGITRLITEHFDAQVHQAETIAQAIDQLAVGRFDLVLVNRVFDANGESGLDLIRKLQADESTRAVPVMLVSNYAEAQTAAQTAGARRGFGKAALNHPDTLDILSTVLSSDARSRTTAKNPR